MQRSSIVYFASWIAVLFSFAEGSRLRAGKRELTEVNATLLEIRLSRIEETLKASAIAADGAFLLSNALVILTMQAGFAMLEAGAVVSSSAISIMTKNLLDLCIGAVAFWCIGYGIAFGEGPNGSQNAVIGEGDYLLMNSASKGHLIHWIWSWSFAATATTILSGALAGRIMVRSYSVVSFLMVGLVYPLAAHALWAGQGWLYKLGAIDFAGSAAIHTLGGAAGLCGTWYLGPRAGVFSRSGRYFPTRSSPLNTIFGAILLVIAWIAFDASSVGSLEGNNIVTAGLAGTNTAISAGIGCIVSISYSIAIHPEFVDTMDLVTGTISALVAVTAPCASIQPWEAGIIGLLGSMAGILSQGIFIYFRIDDPVAALPCHLVNGLTGTIFVGLFANDPSKEGNEYIFGTDFSTPGLFHGGGFRQLGVQLLAALYMLLLGLGSGYAILYTVGLCMTVRVTEEEEKRGLDEVEHNAILVRITTTEPMGPETLEEKKSFRRRKSSRMIVPQDTGGSMPGTGLTMGGELDDVALVTIVERASHAARKTAMAMGGGSVGSTGTDGPVEAWTESTMSQSAGGSKRGHGASGSRRRQGDQPQGVQVLRDAPLELDSAHGSQGEGSADVSGSSGQGILSRSVGPHGLGGEVPEPRGGASSTTSGPLLQQETLADAPGGHTHRSGHSSQSSGPNGSMYMAGRSIAAPDADAMQAYVAQVVRGTLTELFKRRGPGSGRRGSFVGGQDVAAAPSGKHGRRSSQSRIKRSNTGASSGGSTGGRGRGRRASLVKHRSERAYFTQQEIDDVLRERKDEFVYGLQGQEDDEVLDEEEGAEGQQKGAEKDQGQGGAGAGSGDGGAGTSGADPATT